MRILKPSFTIYFIRLSQKCSQKRKIIPQKAKNLPKMNFTYCLRSWKSLDFTVFFTVLTNPQKYKMKNILCFWAIPFIIKKAKSFINIKKYPFFYFQFIKLLKMAILQNLTQKSPKNTNFSGLLSLKSLFQRYFAMF